MERLFLTKINDVYMKATADKHIIEELYHYFTFYAPNYQFDPLYRKKKWDGKIRLFSKRGNKIYVGLLGVVREFCTTFGYEPIIDEKLEEKNDISPEKTQAFMDKFIQPYINIDGEIKNPHDYQYKALHLAIKHKRILFLSPTGSGKSLIIYSIIRFLQSRKDAKRVLLVVPTTSLVEQMYSDFNDYATNTNWDVEKNCHRIHQMYEKQSKKQVFISTWQSIYELPQQYFSQFDAVIVDEVHHAKADSIKGIMEKLQTCEYRIGLTGTLDEVKTHALVLEGLFGQIRRLETTKNLIDRGILSPIKIELIELVYPPEESKITVKMKYMDEMEYLCQHQKRNMFIKNLALNIKGNTLVLFQYVEKHGMILRDLIERDASADRKVFFVYGGTDVTQREEIKQIVRKEKNAIIIASYGTFSTGINIRNIDNAILASPSKSKIRVLQSIGRGLRLSEGKDLFTLFDIIDNFTFGGDNNYVLDHASERIRYYDTEQFEYEIHRVDMR